MSKKFLSFTLTFAFAIMMCGCGQVNNSAKELSTNKTAESLSSKSPNKALQTIENLLQKEVRIDEAYLVGKPDTARAIITNCSAGDDNLYNVWTLNTSIYEPYSIIFLYMEDSKAVMATNTSRDFINNIYLIQPEYKNDEYHNDMNYCDGAFAWEFSNCASVILGRPQGYECSSIWAFNSQENSISLIYFNEELDIWKG